MLHPLPDRTGIDDNFVGLLHCCRQMVAPRLIIAFNSLRIGLIRLAAEGINKVSFSFLHWRYCNIRRHDQSDIF